jgi:hypothetical protein
MRVRAMGIRVLSHLYEVRMIAHEFRLHSRKQVPH